MVEILSLDTVPEMDLRIDLPENNLQIQGILRGALDQPVAILTHGNLGNGNGLLQHTAARYLSDEGIASLRLTMYGPSDHTRDRLNLTQQNYADDITTVANYLRQKGVPKVFGAGHSAGGLALLMATPETPFDALVLWDPSHGICWQEYKDEDMKQMTISGNVATDFTGNAYMRSLAQMNYEYGMGDTTHFAQDKQRLLIISAGTGALINYGKKYMAVASEPKSHISIVGATHEFSEGNALQVLCDETVVWLKQF